MQIFHGTIITCDQHNHVFSYLVEDKGKIIHVGDHLPETYSAATQVELGEKALIPSFGDGHIHFSNWALIAASFFDIRSAQNFAGTGEMIKAFMANNKKNKLVLCFGASKHRVKEKRLITRQELDEFSPNQPLIMFCYDGHSCIINSYFLNKLPQHIHKLRGFNKDTGQLFNEAYYAATDFATSMVPPLILVKSIIKGYDLLAEKGIGMIHPVEGVGFPLDMDVTLVSLIARAQTKQNRFQTRLFFQTMDVAKVLKRKLPRIGGCFATALDGCFGACDAALMDPYSNDPHNKGILFYKDEEVTKFAREANRAGLQIEMHAIGDAATHQAVMAIEQALKDFPREDHRHTIIHACLISPEDLEKCAKLGIGITLQPGFLISPLEPVAYLAEILGSRIKTGSPLKDMIDSGIHLSTGSDAPVTHPDPIEAIYGACNHPYDADQSVSIQQALKMATCEVARTTFDEHQRGSLQQGKMADMVVLNQNPLEMNPKDLLQLKTDRLYLGGKTYKPKMSIFHTVISGLLQSNRNI
ncbi:MAG: amidohydrolase family protein [Thermodesulfobacteriota bacterium]|nr:amidohydrolase family protein [Thermodesulfobacteriota bacterium]